jgi:hypothetical protein
MLKNRFHSWSGCALFVALLAGACGDDKAGFTEPAGSSGNGGSAGWTTVPVGSDPNANGGSYGNAATPSTGGTLGHAGVSGSASSNAGSGGNMLPPITFKCGGKQPNQSSITSFDGFKADRWMSPGNLDGGVYVYPEPLKPTAGEFFGFDGTISDYAGMGVWFSGCIDGSKFRGVRFTISGSVGPGGNVQFYFISNRDKEVVESDSVGACLPDDPNDPWQNCRPPVVTLPVTLEPTTLSIPWSAFKGGLPTATTDGSDLLALQWSFDWLDGNPEYPATLTIDDLQFFDEGEDGSGGAGGAGAPGTVEPGSGGQGGQP